MLAGTQEPILGTLTNWAYVTNKGMVGQWLFNEKTGDIVHDSSMNKNNGTFATGAAAPTWKPNGLYFDGGDYIQDCARAKLNFDEKSEISIRIILEISGGDNTYPISLPEATAGEIGTAIRYNANKIDYILYTHIASSLTDIQFSASVNTIYDIFLTYDGVNAVLYGYKDGVLVGTKTGLSLGAGMKHASGEVNIGRFGTFGANFNGIIYYLAIYDEYKTPSEVTRITNEPFDPGYDEAWLHTFALPSYSSGTSTVSKLIAGGLL